MPKYKFADLSVEMNCQYELVTRRSEKYLTNEAEECDITIELRKKKLHTPLKNTNI